MSRKRKEDLADTGPVICRNCGAEFDASLPNCPYCGGMNLPGAETAYMNKLEGIRDGLEDLGIVGKEETKAHAKRIGKKLLIAGVVLIAIVIGAVVYSLLNERNQAAEDRAEYLWQREGFKELDAYYDAGDYEQLVKAYYSASDEGHNVWQYKHSQFCDYYALIMFAGESLEASKTEGLGSAALFFDELSLYKLESLNNLAGEERALLEKLREPFLLDFEERFPLSEEELGSFRRKLEKDGFLSVEECERFCKEKGWK